MTLMTITLPGAFALFGAMALLAALPSASTLAVVSRAATSGLASGAAVATGVVTGDILFILIAMLGLTVLPGWLGAAFAAAGGCYLIWLGATLWQTAGGTPSGPASSPTFPGGTARLAPDFLAGMFITLADLKAILFYLGFLPAFVDITAATVADVVLVAAVAVVAVGGVKLVYAWAAWRASRILVFRHAAFMQRVAAVVLVVAGVVVIVGALQDGTLHEAKRIRQSGPEPTRTVNTIGT